MSLSIFYLSPTEARGKQLRMLQDLLNVSFFATVSALVVKRRAVSSADGISGPRGVSRAVFGAAIMASIRAAGLMMPGYGQQVDITMTAQ